MLLVGACSSKTGTTPPPDFNYIPLNDQACQLAKASPTVATSANQVLATLVTAPSQSFVAAGLEVCTPNQKNGAPTCKLEDNPLANLMTGMDTILRAALPTEQQAALSGGLVDYFRRALLYPYRELVVVRTACSTLPAGSCPAATSVRLALVQGKHQPCADGASPCTHYSIEPESLDKSCANFPMSLYGAESAANGGTTIQSTLASQAVKDVTFGFVVPLVGTLPEHPETLPAADLEAFLETLNNAEGKLEVRVTDPHVTLDLNAAGNGGYGRLTGWIQRKIFEDYMKKAYPAGADMFSNSLLPSYLDPDRPDFVKAIFTFRLDPGTFTSGGSCRPDPCSGPRNVRCEATTLRESISTDQCTLPRPAGFVSGTAIAPKCEAGKAVDWSIPCGDLGAQCTDNACTTDWLLPAPGELVITELMTNNVNGEREWMEVTNVSNRPLLLTGCVVSSWATSLGERGTIRTAGDLVLGSGKRFVFARPNPAPATNAVSFDYEISDAIHLRTSSGKDEVPSVVQIFCDNQLIDKVEWRNGEWDWKENTSYQLDPSKTTAQANDVRANWCQSTKSYSDGLGTPRLPNDPCP